MSLDLAEDRHSGRGLLLRASWETLRLERCEALVLELCAAFGLRIGVADGETVSPEEFLPVLRRTDAWRLFAEQFGWGSPPEEKLAEPSADATR